MDNESLQTMTIEELNEELAFAKHALCRLVDMAKRMGNKNWRNTPAIRDQLDYVKEVENKIKEWGV